MNTRKTELMNLIKKSDIRWIRMVIYLYIESSAGIKIQPAHYLFEKQKHILIDVANQIISNDTSTQFINEIINRTNEYIIDNENFRWFENNPHACAYLWSRIKNQNNYEFNKNIRDDINRANESNNIPDYLHDNKMRFSKIQLIFDLLNYRTIDKIKTINDFKYLWLKDMNNPGEIKWLSEDNQDACCWAWSYLKNYDDEECKDQFSNTGINSIVYFNPLDDTEKYLSIYAVLRTWTCHHSEKTLFLQNMTKAWKQREFRKNQHDKKVLNCNLHNTVKSHLDELAKAYSMTITDLVAKLIEDEYNLSDKKGNQ